MFREELTRRLRSRPLFRLLPYLARYRSRLLWGSLMVLLTNAAAVITPWVLREAVNTLQSGAATRRLVVIYAAAIVAVSLVEGFFRFLMRRIMIGVSRLIEYDLRNDLFRKLQALSARFFQQNPTGDLMARATNDLSAVRSVLGPGIMYSINTAFTFVMVVSILVGISPSLAILTLIPLVAVSIAVKYFGRRIHDRFEQIQEQFSWLTTLAQENVSGMRVVKAYNQERAFIDRFRTANDEYIRRSLSLVRIWGTFYPLLTLLLGLSMLGLLWWGGYQVMAGRITLGDFVAFVVYLSMLTWPTIALGFVINLFERGSASMSRILSLLDAVPEVDDRHARPGPGLHGALEIRDLDFSYDGRPVLRGIRLKVSPGETLAIVGRTGSGKSTLVHLLARLYPVPDGKIFLDGRDINSIPLAELRRSIGFCPQDAFLFSDTVAGNIAFGRPDASPDEIEEAARISSVLGDIRDFPRGFETLVGERGITLSGGQKQRVTISRALLVDPAILVLDDSLSAVDTDTEEQILRNLSSELGRRTAILISHRISTIRQADRIVVLDDGRIVEEGTHEELLRRDGLYADLYRKQLLTEELDLTA
ncbi:MAG: ABC transporter ATP-binding protein [Acidobacteriota bacterium]